MKKLTILVDIHHLFIAETGLRKYVENLHNLVSSYSSDQHNYIFTPSWEKVNNPNNYRKRKAFLWRALSHLETFIWKQLVIPFKAKKHKADIVFFPDYYGSFWRLHGHKVIVLHDTFFWDNPEHYSPLWLRYFHWATLKGTRNGASILTITNYAKQQILEKLKPQTEVAVIYHSSRQLKHMIGHDQSVLTRLNLIQGKYFLHVGVFEKRKNLLTLVRGFYLFKSSNDEFNSYKLVLVGNRASNSYFDQFDEVVALIGELKLEEHVVLPGYLLDKEITALYASAKSYIFPSLNEGFGMPILEAFEMGCPVITSDQEALVEIGGDATLKFKRLDIDDLGQKLQTMVHDKSLCQDLISKGKRRLTEFAPSVYINKMEEYFESKV